MCRERLNADLAGVEAALAALRPSPSALHRDRLMFLAGQAAGRRRGRLVSWMWPCTSAAAVTAACVLGLLLLERRKPEAVERVVYVQRDRPAGVRDQPGRSPWTANQARLPVTATSAAEDLRYLELRQLVLTHGVEALPEFQPGDTPRGGEPVSPPTQGRMLGRLLDG